MSEVPVDEVIDGLLLLEHLHKGDGDPKWRGYIRKAIERLAPVSDSELRHAIVRILTDHRMGGMTQYTATNTLLYFIRRERQKIGTPRVPAAPSLEPGLPSHPTQDEILARMKLHQEWAEQMAVVLWDEHARAAMRQAANNFELAQKYIRTAIEETVPPLVRRMDER